MELVKPSLQALLVCDMVIEDRSTGKKSLIGLFNQLWSLGFPCQHPQLGLYFCLTDAEGSYDFSVDLVCINSEQIVGRASIQRVEIKDRLGIVDFGLTLRPIIFPIPGRYEFRLYANGVFIGLKDFQVLQVETPPQGA